MKNEENNMTELSCDPITKPTMPPPGGSKLGYWACDKTTGTWVWNDSVAVEG